jgi:hypothetical protein
VAKRLGADENHVYVYYACAGSTLRGILADGIRCRDSLPASVDLSSPDVQSRRSQVRLGRVEPDGSERVRDTQIHSCVNLFWNPLNRTFEAFQRSALLRSVEASNPEHRTVCLLELDVEAILADDSVYWAATDGNAAARPHTSHDHRDLVSFPWRDIYSTDGQEHHNARAAELILFVQGSGELFTGPIPCAYITRVILPPGMRLTSEQEALLSEAHVSCQSADVYKNPSELLRAETGFLKTLAELWPMDPSIVQRLVFAARALNEFELQHGGPTADRFLSPAAAHGPHGIGHAARVMFWSACVATYACGLLRTSRHTAAVLVASLHDLSREGTGSESGHGARAAEHFRPEIGRVMSEPELRLSCESAVRTHDVDDLDCSRTARDWLWAVLKDADAIDRGRFGAPGSEKGCRSEMLRLGHFGRQEKLSDAREKFAWMAYWLSGITRYSQWGDRPCRRLLLDLVLGLRAGLQEDAFRGRFHDVAILLVQELTPILNGMGG